MEEFCKPHCIEGRLQITGAANLSNESGTNSATALVKKDRSCPLASLTVILLIAVGAARSTTPNTVIANFLRA